MASSSSSSFSSMLGSMDTDAALAKLGLSREQLNGHTLQMRQFLSSDTTFTPKPPRLPATPAQPASSSQPTFSTPDNAPSPVPRSRSMDHIAIPVAATPQAQPHQTPSRTRKLSDADLSLPEERPSKRQRGEKVPGKPSSAAGPPPPPPYPTRVQYPSTSAHPSLPPTPSSAHQDVFSVANSRASSIAPSVTASADVPSGPSTLVTSTSSQSSTTTVSSNDDPPKKHQAKSSTPSTSVTPISTPATAHAAPATAISKPKANNGAIAGPSQRSHKSRPTAHPHPVPMGMPMPVPYMPHPPPPASSKAAKAAAAAGGFIHHHFPGGLPVPPPPPHVMAATQALPNMKVPPGFTWVPIDPKLPYALPPPPYTLNKPSASFPALIGNALRASLAGRLTYHDILSYIATAHPYFQSSTPPDAWKVAVKQTLESCLAFVLVKIDKTKLPPGVPVPPSMWMIRQDHVKFFVNGEYTKPLHVDKEKVATGSSSAKTEAELPTTVALSDLEKVPSVQATPVTTLRELEASSPAAVVASSPAPVASARSSHRSSTPASKPVTAAPKASTSAVAGSSKAMSSKKPKMGVPPPPPFFPGMPGMPGMPMFAPHPGFFMPGMPGMPGMPMMPPGMPHMMPGFMPPMPPGVGRPSPKKGARPQPPPMPFMQMMQMGMPGMPGMPMMPMPMPGGPPPRPMAAPPPKPKKVPAPMAPPQPKPKPAPVPEPETAEEDTDMADDEVPERTPSPVERKPVRPARGRRDTAPPELSPSTTRTRRPPLGLSQAPRKLPPVIPSSSPAKPRERMLAMLGTQESDSSSSEDEPPQPFQSLAGDLAPSTPLQAAATLSLGSGRRRASTSGSGEKTWSLMERMLTTQTSPLRSAQRPVAGCSPTGKSTSGASPAVDIARAMRTPSLMERTLARKDRAKKILGSTPKPLALAMDDDEDETEEATPSPAKVLPLSMPSALTMLDTISPLAIMKPEFLTARQVAVRGEDVEDEDGEGFRSNHSSPGVPLAQLMAMKERAAVGKSAFSRFTPTNALQESPDLDEDIAGVKKLQPKKSRRRAKKNWGGKKKKKTAKTVIEEPEDDEDDDTQEPLDDDDYDMDVDVDGSFELEDSQQLSHHFTPDFSYNPEDDDELDPEVLTMTDLPGDLVHERFKTPEPQFSQSALTNSPYRTPSRHRNMQSLGYALASGSGLSHSKSETDLAALRGERPASLALRSSAMDAELGGPMMGAIDSPGRSASIFRTPNLYATPKRGGSASRSAFLSMSPFKTPIVDDPYSNQRALEAQLAAMSPIRGLDGMPLTSPGGTTTLDAYGMPHDPYMNLNNFLRSPGAIWN